MRIVLFFLLASLPIAAQSPVRYEVRFDGAAQHEARITMTASDLPGGPLEVRMSRSSPGRYALHEFAKNVYDVSAIDSQGRRLTIHRPDPYQWDVHGHDGTVRFEYTLFGNRGDGTYAQITETHAILNAPATFAFARGLERREARVTFRLPEGLGWKIATQLRPTGHPQVFVAKNRDRLMDAPCVLSPFTVREWDVARGGRAATIRLAVNHTGGEEEVDRFAALVKQVVDEEIALFGAPPRFDHGTYTFLANYRPEVVGDGMEHRNSTIVSSSSPLAGNELRHLGTVSHEFFHAWNVERLRPRSLEPFDFERANMSRELWFAEGFTSYYTPLFIQRAGLSDLEAYVRDMEGTLRAVIHSQARRHGSPVTMSMWAPFADAARSVDPTNAANVFLSYYTWGAAVGLALDLTLRADHEKDLDGWFRQLFKRFGEPETPYTLEDLERELSSFTGDEEFAREFFDRFIRGASVPDYERLLANAGILMTTRSESQASLGQLRLRYTQEGAVLNASPLEGTPLFGAGLREKDVITEIAGQKAPTAAGVREALATRKPGDRLPLTFLRNGVTTSLEVTLVTDPTLSLMTFERAGRPITEAHRAFRAQWLGSKVAPATPR